MSHYRKNSVRNKVIGKKWIYSDQREAHSTESVGHCRGQVLCQNLAWLVFIGWVTSYANEGKELFQILGAGVEFSRNWKRSLLGLLTVAWNCVGASRCVI